MQNHVIKYQLKNQNPPQELNNTAVIFILQNIFRLRAIFQSNFMNV